MKKNLQSPLRAFTLIELLIVVAIIAILAAIAVPNFLEAQTRAKIARVRADIRTIATGLESYFVDHNKYPPTPFTVNTAVTAGATSGAGVLRVTPSRITTPISYLSTADFLDPFILTGLDDFQAFDPNGTPAMPLIFEYAQDPTFVDPAPLSPTAGRRYYYQANFDGRRGATTQEILAEAAIVEGAWVLASFGPNKVRDFQDTGIVAPSGFPVPVLMPYDSSNGTISDGDIIRSQKESEGTLQGGNSN